MGEAVERQASVTTPEEGRVPGVPLGELLLLDAGQAAEILGMCRAMFYRLNSAGRVPRPIRLGGKLVRWRRGELTAWVAAGCPNREQWESGFQRN